MVEAIVINGLVTGGMFAILSVGFSLLFGAAKLVFIGYTIFFMIGAFFILIGTTQLGLPLPLTIILSIGLTGVVGVISYRVAVDRVKEQRVAVLIITLAIALFLQEVFLIRFGGHFRGIDPFISGFVEIAGIRATYQHIIAVVASLLVLGGVWWMLSKTRLGVALRAVADDREIANVMGINVGGIGVITVGIAAALAAVAGAVVAPIMVVHPLMWNSPMIVVLAIVVLGGLGSIKGSIIAAFILGFVEVAVVFLVPMGAFLRGAASLSVMVLILLFRPEGLFGVVFEEERL